MPDQIDSEQSYEEMQQVLIGTIAEKENMRQTMDQLQKDNAALKEQLLLAQEEKTQLFMSHDRDLADRDYRLAQSEAELIVLRHQFITFRQEQDLTVHDLDLALRQEKILREEKILMKKQLEKAYLYAQDLLTQNNTLQTKIHQLEFQLTSSRVSMEAMITASESRRQSDGKSSSSPVAAAAAGSMKLNTSQSTEGVERSKNAAAVVVEQQLDQKLQVEKDRLHQEAEKAKQQYEQELQDLKKKLAQEQQLRLDAQREVDHVSPAVAARSSVGSSATREQQQQPLQVDKERQRLLREKEKQREQERAAREKQREQDRKEKEAATAAAAAAAATQTVRLEREKKVKTSAAHSSPSSASASSPSSSFLSALDDAIDHSKKFLHKSKLHSDRVSPSSSSFSSSFSSSSSSSSASSASSSSSSSSHSALASSLDAQLNAALNLTSHASIAKRSKGVSLATAAEPVEGEAAARSHKRKSPDLQQADPLTPAAAAAAAAADASSSTSTSGRKSSEKKKKAKQAAAAVTAAAESSARLSSPVALSASAAGTAAALADTSALDALPFSPIAPAAATATATAAGEPDAAVAPSKRKLFAIQAAEDALPNKENAAQQPPAPSTKSVAATATATAALAPQKPKLALQSMLHANHSLFSAALTMPSQPLTLAHTAVAQSSAVGSNNNSAAVLPLQHSRNTFMHYLGSSGALKVPKLKTIR